MREVHRKLLAVGLHVGRIALICLLATIGLSARAITIETDTIVGPSDVGTYTAASEIEICEGATLLFQSLTADATFKAKITGAGHFVAANASAGSYRITLNGDATSFTGGFFVTNLLLTATKPDAVGSASVVLCNTKASTHSYLNGSGTYRCPCDIECCTTAGYGFHIGDGVKLAADVLWRSGRIQGPGEICGVVTLGSTSCYPGGGVHFAGGISATSSYSLLGDGEDFFIDAKSGKVSGPSGIRTMKGTAGFGAANVLDPAQKLQIAGANYGRWGSFDLLGFDQTAGFLTFGGAGPNTLALELQTKLTSSTGSATLTFTAFDTALTYNGQIDGHLSLCVAGSKTLTLKGTANTTDGALIASNGTIAVSKDAVFDNLTRLIVRGNGTLNVHTAKVNPGRVEVELDDTGKFKVLADVTLDVSRVKVDGKYLDPGAYTKDSPELGNHVASDFGGVLKVENGAPPEEGETFVWKGGADNNDIRSAANWFGDASPSFDGTERLLFGGGSEEVVVSDEIRAFAIDVISDRGFTLTGDGGSAKIVLMSSLAVSNSASGGSINLNLNCPVELGSLPQEWSVAKNSTLMDRGSIIGPESDALALTIRSVGRVCFYADNSTLLTPLVLTNCNSAAGQPYVYHRNGLGGSGRFTTIFGAVPRLVAETGGDFTNATPISLYRGSTGDHGNLNGWYDSVFYQEGCVKVFGGDANIMTSSRTHFTGGIVSEDGSGLTLRPRQNYGIWIDKSTVKLSGAFTTDYPNEIHLGESANSWTGLSVVKSTMVCDAVGALCPDAPVAFGSGNAAYWAENFGTIDLAGNDQSAARVSVNWNPLSTSGGKRWGDSFVVLASSGGSASLEVRSSSDDLLPLKVVGEAGIHFNGSGSIAFTNFLSTTSGELKISKGTVRFLAGSGWTSTSNVVLNGGMLSIGKGTGAIAFGVQQGRSKARMVRKDGELEIEAGEMTTVRSLACENGEGVRTYLPAGVYGGAEAGLDASHTLGWISGGGRLRVLRSSERDGLILFVR